MWNITGQFEGMDRRKFLARAGLAAGAATATTVLPGTAAAAPPPWVPRRPREAKHRTRVVLLGTGGGPTWWPDNPKGISSVLVVEDNAYLIDCGDGAGLQWARAGLSDPQRNIDFTRLRAMFLTHLHSDHTVSLPSIILYGHPTFQGSTPGEPLPIFGPGRRGALPEVFPPDRPEPPVINPDNSTPGTEDMVEALFQMFANDINVRSLTEGRPDPRADVAAHDIALPPGAGDDPNGPVPTLLEPIEVYEDDLVRVTATLADHLGSFPSFAFRFDTADGSVVFSGDTTTHDNIVSLAEDVDILVHEVIDEEWAEQLAASFPEDQREPLLHHLIGSHTTIEQVGPVADSAGARTLVLSHLVPANNPRRRWRGAKRGYSGRLIIGEDLAQIGVGSRLP